MNFIQRLKVSVFNIEKYQDFTQEKFSVAIKYFLKLILLLSVIVAIFSAYKFGNLASFFMDTLKNDFPEFTFSNNILVAEETINKVKENRTEKINLIVDTNSESTEETVNKYITEISKYPNGAIFLKDKVVFSVEGLSGQVMYNYKDLDLTGTKELTKQKLVETLNNTNITAMYISVFIAVLFYMYIIYLITTILDVVFVGIIGYLTSKIVKINMKASQVYSLAVYSMTLSVLLNALYTPIRLLTGFNMEYFSVMYTLIPYVYIITAILMIRTDLVKQQIEIGKIKKVQEEVKNEIEERKREEKKEEQEKKKDKKEEKDKNENQGGEPEGSEA